MGVPTLEDATSYPPTPSPLVAQSPKALLTVLEDQPLEAANVEVEREMDAFADDLKKVLTFDGGVPKEGYITTILSDP